MRNYPGQGYSQPGTSGIQSPTAKQFHMGTRSGYASPGAYSTYSSRFVLLFFYFANVNEFNGLFLKPPNPLCVLRKLYGNAIWWSHLFMPFLIDFASGQPTADPLAFANVRATFTTILLKFWTFSLIILISALPIVSVVLQP